MTTRQIGSIVLNDGSHVQPTEDGIETIERLVRDGLPLAKAVEFITHCPEGVRRRPTPAPAPLMEWCPSHEYRPIVSMGEDSVTLDCGYRVM